MKTTALAALLGFALLGWSASPVLAQSGGKRGKVVTAAEVFEQMVKDMKAKREKEPWDKRRNAVNPYDALDVRSRAGSAMKRLKGSGRARIELYAILTSSLLQCGEGTQ